MNNFFGECINSIKNNCHDNIIISKLIHLMICNYINIFRNLLNMTFDIARLEKHFFLFPLPWKEYNFKRLSVNRNCMIRLTNILIVFPPSPIKLFI